MIEGQGANNTTDTESSCSRTLRHATTKIMPLLLVGAAFGAAAHGCAPPRGTIGAVLGQASDGRVFLREVPEGLAAARADLEPGDELLLIDGADVRRLSAEELHRRLSGEIGETVKLTLLRGDQVLRVTLKRTPAKRRTGRGP